MNVPRTINILLTTGNPNGIKKIGVSNRPIRGYVIPRIQLAEARQFVELTQPALYLLFNHEATKAYIGESENFIERVKNHDQDKDFWDIAVAFISKDKNLEKGDVKYLESLAVEASKSAGRIKTQNKIIPLRNSLSEFKIPTIHEFFDDLMLLVSTLGFPLFDKVKTEGVNDEYKWYCHGKATNAQGIYSLEGFTVLANSLISAKNAPSFTSGFPREVEARMQLLKVSAEQISESSYKLNSNLTFASVSRASSFCLGRSSNGWTDWRNLAGKTLDDVIRRSIN